LIRWFLFAALAFVSACQAPPPSVARHEFLAFGTLVSAMEDFQYMHGAWHPWEPGPLARVNALLPLWGRFTYPPSLRPVLLRARELSRASGGRPPGPPPEAEAIARWLAARPRLDDVVIDGLEMVSTNPAVVLDFGGFAKGYGVDRVIEHLRELGVRDAIVNAGGDLRAIGDKGGRPWQVGIRDPRAPGVLARLAVSGDESVFTSGDYERFFEYQGRRYHHILDPRTGYPARGLVSVTVVTREGALADAAATALMVAGPEDWPRVARAMGVDQVMVVTEAGEIQVTPALAGRLQWEKPVPEPHVRPLP